MTEQLRLDYIMFFAEDVPAAVAFYADAFGAISIEERYPHWARLRVGGTDLGFHRGTPPGEAVTSVRAAFQVEDIAALRTHLEAKGVTILGGYHDIPGGVVLTFKDPAGNGLQAVAYGKQAAELASK